MPGEYGMAADLYGYGVILWEIVARERPFADLNEFAIAYQVSTQGLQPTPPVSASCVLRCAALPLMACKGSTTV
jgi:hypothetical protein